MRVVIAGSRTVDDFTLVCKAIEGSGFEITELVSGTAKGADSLGEWWAGINSVPIKKFPANWDKYGKAAGPIRNAEMADYADAAIVVVKDKSTGAMNMIKQMAERDKPHYAVYIGERPE